MTGNELLALSLKSLGVKDLFYLMGGPMLHAARACLDAGIRGIDVRHEQAAAMAAHAYSRTTGAPGVCMACSGPGTTNLATGIAAAWADRAPLIALGGASGIKSWGRGGFQEMDQVAFMAPITKRSVRIYETARIPEILHKAWHWSLSGSPGPVYVDLPEEVLYGNVESAQIQPMRLPVAQPCADRDAVDSALRRIMASRNPVVLAGSGVIWSGAEAALKALVERLRLPVLTTPMARGVLDESHDLCVPGARSLAFREADTVLVVGTRLNYVVGYGLEPRFKPDAQFIRLDLDVDDLTSLPRPIKALHGGVRPTLELMLAILPTEFVPPWEPWLEQLRARDEAKRIEIHQLASAPAETIHPLLLCEAVARRLKAEDLLVVDGHETLIYSRQAIPAHRPRTHLNPGPFGCMGVGVPYGIGASTGSPAGRVVVLTGDGSFGMNGVEIDTAVRHGLDLLVIICNNGGWTSDPVGNKPGRNLGFTSYEELARALGANFVARASDKQTMEAALDEAFNCAGVRCINVMTDPMARAGTTHFIDYPFMEMEH
jgi:acetolactate synthase-1/2/3 large subunit